MSNVFDIDVSPETPELLAIAEKDLRETPEIRAKGLAELRELLKQNSDIYYCDEDEFLVPVLRTTHWYPESAMKLIRQIAEFRKEHWKLLKDLMPEQEKVPFIEGNLVNILTNKDHKQRRMLVVNGGKIWNPDQISYDCLFRMFYMLHILAQLEKTSQICGCVVIYDFEGLGMKQIKSMSPSSIQRLLNFIQYAMPLRIKEIHFVKQPLIFEMVWALMKPFLQEKLKKRIHFHGDDMKKLHKFIPADSLPKNYGGTMPEINYSGKEWYPLVEKYNDYFLRYKDVGFKDLK
ncbi:hypothetical protein ACKWTF_009683 [Chironomus riparius]